MRIGYIRVSTAEQNIARQESLLSKYDVQKIFIDKTSGKDTNRPEFKSMMSFIRNGDELVVESFSRLSRSLKDLLNIVDVLNSNKIRLISVKENVDTKTPQGKLMVSLFGALSQFERELILERQREGIEIAKAKGKYKGRQPIQVDDRFFEITKRWINSEITLRETLTDTKLSRSTFFRKCKQYGIRKEQPPQD